MLHAGLDLSRRKVDAACSLSKVNTSTSSPFHPDVESLRRLARRIVEVQFRRAGLRGR